MFEDWPAFDVTEHQSSWSYGRKKRFEDWPAFDVTEPTAARHSSVTALRLRIGRLLMSRNFGIRNGIGYPLVFEDWPAFDVTEPQSVKITNKAYLFEDWPAFDVTELRSLVSNIEYPLSLRIGRLLMSRNYFFVYTPAQKLHV